MVDIEKIKRRLLVKYPLFGSVVANTNFFEASTVPTAGTDGKNIYYNESFVSKLSDDEKTFIFAHEICHIAFDHISRSEGKDPKTWNIATDAVINALLKKDGLKITDGAVDIKEAMNYDAEEMYNKLLEQKKDSNQMQDEKKQGQSDEHKKQKSEKNRDGENSSLESNQNNDHQNEDVGHDTHSMWGKSLEEQNDDSINEADQTDSKEAELKKQTIKRLSKIGEKKIFNQNQIERKKQIEELRDALAKQSHGVGTGTNKEKIKMDNIGTSSPLIDWRKLLKEAVSYNVDWSYKNASVEDGVVTPYLENIPTPETEILLDTSGSISETLLRNFLRECKNILQNSKVKVGCFDDTFYGYTEIRNEYDIDNMEFCGGGGTNFDVAVNAFTRRVENKIIFTDGEASMPHKQVDAIWIIFGGRKIKPPGGKVINIDDDALEKLSSSYNKTR